MFSGCLVRIQLQSSRRLVNRAKFSLFIKMLTRNPCVNSQVQDALAHYARVPLKRSA